MQRVIDLDAVPNLRDLGGLATRSGSRVAGGRLFRSGSLHEMTEADRAVLEGLGITTVIDLRSTWEQDVHGYRWPGRTVVSAPLAEDDDVAAIFRRFQSGSMRDRDIEDWWQLTGVIDAPARSVDSIRMVFRTLLDASPGDAVLFHCRGGKDRTGVVAALILEALGVERGQVFLDFLLSNRGARERAVEFARRLNSEFGSTLSAEALFSIAGVKEEWLQELLGRLETRFGSVRGYLTRGVGLNEEDLTALQHTYLQPPA